MINSPIKPGHPNACAWLLALLVFLLPGLPAAWAATTIDIMLVYDTTASTWVASNGGINAFSQDQVTRMNQAMQNSGIDARFRLVHTMTVNYTTTARSGSPLSGDLYALSSNSGLFAEVHAARTTYGADLVAMLIDHGSASGYIGVAWVLTRWSGDSTAAFSVSAIRAAAISHVLTHEVGHNLGADHSKFQAQSPGPNRFLDGQYSAGWYFTGSNGRNYHSIMAYDDDGYGTRYSEAPLFSTPLRTHQGGVAGDALHGDNARLIRQTMDIVAAYRPTMVDADLDQDAPPAPSEPDPLTLAVLVDGSGQVRALPGDLDCGDICAQSYSPGTALTLTATPDAGWAFAGWMGACSGLSATCRMTLNQPTSVVATFEQQPAAATAQLNLTPIGAGYLTSTPGDLEWRHPGQHSYPVGARVSLSARPDPGASFLGWGGACENQGLSTTCNLIMDGHQQVIAAFNHGLSRGNSTAWAVTEIYVATLGYAPDNQGLAYWINNINTLPQWTPETVAGSFFDQPLVRALYPPDAGHSSFIHALYLNLFGRSPDRQGYDYWLAQLQSGAINRQFMIIALINGGWHNTSPDARSDMQRLGHRIQVALAFAEYQAEHGIVFSQLSQADQQYLRQVGRDILHGVTADKRTRDARINGIPTLLAPLIP